MATESIGGWLVLLVPIFLGAPFALKEYAGKFITEWILTFLTIGMLAIFSLGVCMYAPTGGYFLIYVLLVSGFSYFGWQQIFKTLEGIASKCRSTSK